MRSLFICNAMEELQYLKDRCEGEYLIGTIDMDFYILCSNAKECVVFLESEDTMLNYNRDTWDIIDKINDIIKSCKLEQEYLYKISYHIEGGLPLHIAETLSNIKLLNKIIEKNCIKKINMIDSAKNWKMNEAAFLAAYYNEMEYVISDVHGFKTKDCLYTLERTGYKIGNKECSFSTEKQSDRISRLLEQDDHKKDTLNEQYDIGFLYAAVDNGKHYVWLMGDLPLFKDDFKIGIIVFYDSGDVSKFRSQGFHVDCIEEYFDKTDFMKKYRIYLRDCKTIITALNNNFHVAYAGIDMTEFLRRKVINCLEREVFDHLYMDSCMEKYFAYKKYRLIETWGTSNFWQTQLAYANTKNAGTKFWRIETNEILYGKFYEPDADIISIRFFANHKIRDKVELKDFSGNCYYCYDYVYGEQFYKNCDLAKKPVRSPIKILFAPTYPFPGISTLKNYIHTCSTILGELPNAGYKIIFKNHPNIDRSLETEIYDKYCDNENIEIVDKYENISEAFCKCEFVITDASSVLFDSAVAQKPVFCIVGCQDYELSKQHEEGFCMYRDVIKMCESLVDLLGKPEQLEEKLNKMIERQNAYIKKIVGVRPVGHPMKYIHDILKSEMGGNVECEKK